VCTVVKQAPTKIQEGSKARRTIYLRKDLWEDSGFPFKVGEPLVVKIEKDTLVIEREKPKK
jgi:hypothetical protein